MGFSGFCLPHAAWTITQPINSLEAVNPDGLKGVQRTVDLQQMPSFIGQTPCINQSSIEKSIESVPFEPVYQVDAHAEH